MADTMKGYLTAAELFLKRHVPAPFSLYTGDSNSKRLVPELNEIFRLKEKWQQPMEQRLPYTYDMFDALHDHLNHLTSNDVLAPLSLDASVFDWTRLGVFTGCRISEFAQTSSPRGQFARVPNTIEAGMWATYPLAFIADDFTFYCYRHLHMQHSEVITHPERICFVELRWRFDKSGRNFTVKKFGRGAGLICPIDALVSILRRAHILQVPKLHPIGVFQAPSSKSGYTFLKSDDVIKVMRKACVLAYPDEHHYYRINIHRIVSHSNRVTAACALRAAGLEIDAIAARLRWKPDSVSHYLRECEQMITDFTMFARQGIHAI